MLPHSSGPGTQLSALRTPALSRPSITRYDTPVGDVSPLPEGAARATVCVLTGLDAGRIVPVERDAIVVGRAAEAELQVEDVSVSRLHARIRRRAGTFFVEDMGSTNGTFLHSARVDVAPLADGDHIQLGPQVLLRFALTRPADEQLQAHLYESSIRDALTRTYNRRYLHLRLALEVAHARRHQAPLSALMLDVDRFKECNDRYGHFVGDRLLCFVALQLSKQLRAGDVLARYGGDEFVVLGRDADLAEALAAAERLRRAVGTLPLAAGGAPITITLSAGVGALSEIGAEDRPEALLELVDRRLLSAKQAGRNRIVATEG
jgi:diguanylate cyclase (GGDEF)-like protein